MKKINLLLILAGSDGAAFLARAVAEATITDTAPETDAIHEFTVAGMAAQSSS